MNEILPYPEFASNVTSAILYVNEMKLSLQSNTKDIHHKSAKFHLAEHCEKATLALFRIFMSISFLLKEKHASDIIM